MHDAKESYATSEARVNATIKQEEDLNAQATAMAQREQVAADQELKPQEREEQDDHEHMSTKPRVPGV